MNTAQLKDVTSSVKVSKTHSVEKAYLDEENNVVSLIKEERDTGSDLYWLMNNDQKDGVAHDREAGLKTLEDMARGEA